jgi:long-chain acyl-CoA synthetase
MNLFEMLLQTTQRNPDQTALIFRDKPISYGQLLGAVSGVAKGFKELGVEKGDRVAILLPNAPQFVMAYYACQALGAIAVPANPLLKPDELRYIYNDAGVKAAVTIPLLADVLRAVKPQVPSLQHMLMVGGEAPDFLPFDALWQQQAPVPTPPEFNPREHPAVFLYTSGTTGFPKGCMLSHRNLIANCESCVPVLEMSPQDNFLTVLAALPCLRGHGVYAPVYLCRVQQHPAGTVQPRRRAGSHREAPLHHLPCGAHDVCRHPALPAAARV